jgi:clan AA aspartic protease
MITGTINSASEAMLRLTVRGPNGQRRRISAVIDTGYNGALTLPSAVIADLELPWMKSDTAVLADGSTIVFEIYVGIVVWDRRPIRILVDEADTTPLVGMALLHGFELNMKVQRRGQVTIKRLGGSRAR